MDRPTDTYLIFGDDEYLVEEALRRVIGVLRTRHGEDLAVETVDYKEEGVGGLADRFLRGPPHLGEVLLGPGAHHAGLHEDGEAGF